MKGIKNPKLIIIYILNFKILRIIPDTIYLKIKYRFHMGKKLNLDNPKTYNEKLQWLKLYDRNVVYTDLVDKYKVRNYISKFIGEEYLIPLLGVYDSFEEINFEKLPNDFVLKPNHTSGNIYICKDKSKIDYLELKKEVNRWLKRNYYWIHREWPYKNIKPKIICEKYMVDESGTELKDYKIFCFNGEPKVLFIVTGREFDMSFDFYDMEFNHLPFWNRYRNGVKEIIKPKGFDEMVRLASELSKDIPHVRVDFYDINGKVYFGELTLYHASGYAEFHPEKYDEVFGEWLKLPKNIK